MKRRRFSDKTSPQRKGERVMEKETMRKVNVTELNAPRSKEKPKIGTAFETQDEQRLENPAETPSIAVPSAVVTLNSRVHLEDPDTGRQFVYTLVSPGAADLAENKISVMAPIGKAINRQKPGALVEFTVPAGLRRLRVKRILDQSEAQGAAPKADDTPRRMTRARQQIA
jgi:regulator of nucleoside diphosphate kinase